MSIHPRSDWGARPAKSRRNMRTPTPRLWLHHSAGRYTNGAQAPAELRGIQNYHMGSRGWQDIAYSFLTDNGGGAWTGRGAGIQGGHTAGDNSTSHAICAMGNYETTMPPEQLLQGIAGLVRTGHARGWWPSQITGGHRQAPGASTACPGRYLYGQIGEINRRARSTSTLPPKRPTPKPPVPPSRSWFDMATKADLARIIKNTGRGKPVAIRDSRTNKVWICDGNHRSHVKSMPTLMIQTFIGHVEPGIVNGNTASWHKFLDELTEK